MGDSMEVIRGFPESVRQDAGYNLHLLQAGLEPLHWRPMASVGSGVAEIRIKDATGIYRILYIAKYEEAVYVLHAFQKKTQKTARTDLDVARKRLQGLDIFRKG